MQADTSISNRNWLTELKMSPVRDAYTSYFNGVALTYPAANILCWFAQNLATVNVRAASLKPAHLLACAQCVSSVCDLKGPKEWTRRWKGYLPLSLSVPFFSHHSVCLCFKIKSKEIWIIEIKMIFQFSFILLEVSAFANILCLWMNIFAEFLIAE